MLVSSWVKLRLFVFRFSLVPALIFWMDSAKFLQYGREHKWRASRDLEALLRRQNDLSKQLLGKEAGSKDDVREKAILVEMQRLFLLFLFFHLVPSLLCSLVLTTQL